MIQRIQTLYLLVAAALMAVTLFAPIATFSSADAVYTLGAFAFALFGSFYRDREHWQLSDAAFAAARRAVSPQCAERPQSIAAFANDWEKAVRS